MLKKQKRTKGIPKSDAQIRKIFEINKLFPPVLSHIGKKHSTFLGKTSVSSHVPSSHRPIKDIPICGDKKVIVLLNYYIIYYIIILIFTLRNLQPP